MLKAKHSRQPEPRLATLKFYQNFPEGWLKQTPSLHPSMTQGRKVRQTRWLEKKIFSEPLSVFLQYVGDLAFKAPCGYPNQPVLLAYLRQYLHVTFTHPTVHFKSSLNSLQYLMRCKCSIIVHCIVWGTMTRIKRLKASSPDVTITSGNAQDRKRSRG